MTRLSLTSLLVVRGRDTVRALLCVAAELAPAWVTVVWPVDTRTAVLLGVGQRRKHRRQSPRAPRITRTPMDGNKESRAFSSSFGSARCSRCAYRFGGQVAWLQQPDRLRKLAHAERDQPQSLPAPLSVRAERNAPAGSVVLSLGNDGRGAFSSLCGGHLRHDADAQAFVAGLPHVAAASFRPT